MDRVVLVSRGGTVCRVVFRVTTWQSNSQDEVEILVGLLAVFTSS